MSEHVGESLAGSVLVLNIHRPGKRNALTGTMYDALAEAHVAAARRPEVRCVLFLAEGEDFSAGNDIAEFAAAARLPHPPMAAARFLEALVALPLPAVAAVQGRAVGIGTTMLLHCDHVVLADDARLGAPFLDLVIVPEAASSLLLAQRLGHSRAFAMFVLGEVLVAAEAERLGLANAVVPRGRLDQAGRDVAARIAGQPSAAVRATKQLMRDVSGLLSHMAEENGAFVEHLRSPEAQAAFAAFAGRRGRDAI